MGSIEVNVCACRWFRGLRTCCTALLLASVWGCATPRAVFVSPTGDDNLAGSKTAPFATIPRAMAAVRDLRDAPGPGGPITVYLRGGLHTLDEKLTFGPEDSGTARCPVTYTSCRGERAVISGGRRIAGAWRKSPGKEYYELLVPEAKNRNWVFFSLYVNGMSRTRARTPNWGEKVYRAQGRAPGEDERQSFCYFPGDIDPSWTNVTDVDLVLLCSWTPTLHRIEEVVGDRNVVKFISTHHRSCDFWEKNFRYYASNVFEALDEPGEWYLNRDTGMLYYYPMPGEDMTSVEVVAPVLKTRLLEFMGDVPRKQFIEYLTFRDLDIRHCDGDMDRYNGVYRQGHMYLTGGIYAQGLRNCAFTDCEIAQLGEYGMEMADGCRNNLIQRCHIWDMGAGAIQLGVTDLRRLLAGRMTCSDDDIVLEAENAVITAPLVVENKLGGASGDYIYLPSDQSGGSAVFTVSGKPGVYRMMARLIAPGGSSDSFTVKVNDGPTYIYDTGSGQEWFLSQVKARELNGGPVEVELCSQPCTITIGGREPEAKLDQLILQPVRHGEGSESKPSEAEVLSNVIDNNCIHRLGTIWHGCYGIVNRFASFTQITHNDMFDMHWDPIGLDARWHPYNGENYSHGNVVAYNHLHHYGLGYHTDSGAIYQYGPLDTHIHHNHIHDAVAYPYICGTSGIYLDEQSCNAVVESNLVYNVDWYAYFQHKGVDNVFRNNIGAFARDGLIRRGGLNERWKANHLEAYSNIYVADNDIALRGGWKPGDRPPVLRNNMYCTLAENTELTFAGKTFAEWQAEGQDAGSVVGDPGLVDPANRDFSVKRGAPCIDAIGFRPFDKEIKEAGLYGSAKWRALPGKQPRRKPTKTWNADDLGTLISFEMDFEDMPDGYQPPALKVATDQDVVFAVTSEAACTGEKSWKCIDKKGLKKDFYPYASISPRRCKKGLISFSFDAMNSVAAPTHFYVEFRGKGGTSAIGPSLHFNIDGSLVANGKTILTAKPGTWCRVEISFDLRDGAPDEYSLLTRCNGFEQRQVIPYTHAAFDTMRWLGISACDDADGVFYLDNVALKIK